MSVVVVRAWLVAAAVSAAVVGCSSNTPTDAPTEEPAPTSTTSEHGSYAHCLAENGVDTPPAGPGTPPGVDEDTWLKAQEACASYAPGPPSQ